ncbi:MAG TPA: magnesium transporter CorA family protein [Mycobacteriales bacterium]|nr:magnesium transporter CorA family protein [Mycobacteriales bacterium]
MIRTRVYRDGSCVEEDFSPQRISDFLEETGTVVWMDVTEPTAEEFALIAEEFTLNPLAVEDALQERQRPKLDHYDDHVFLSLYDVELDRTTGELDTAELAVFASPRYLITVRKDPRFPMDEVVHRWDDNAQLASHGTGFLLWGLLDVVVDGHFEAVQQLDDEIDTLEDLLFEDTPRGRGLATGQNNTVQRRSFELRKSLVVLRRVVLPTREVVNALMRREAKVVDADLTPYYQDVYDHVLRATDWADSLRDLVATILETNLTIQGNRMNEIMKAVTSWAAIAAVPTIITGYYGMNVRIFPAAQTLTGGLLAIALMVFGVGLLYVMFKRRDWL